MNFRLVGEFVRTGGLLRSIWDCIVGPTDAEKWKSRPNTLRLRLNREIVLEETRFYVTQAKR